MSAVKKLLIITSGGDSPGMNAVLRGVVRTALHSGIVCMGARFGYKGIYEEDIFEMDTRSVANIVQRGGTILKSTRFPEFKQQEVRKKAAGILKKHDVDALVVLGGDGSFRGAKLLEEEAGLKVIGIPCTID